jgi:bifunctional NMN adenylyltransferase/nudix hydrolase
VSKRELMETSFHSTGAKRQLGVIIARFQTDELTTAHRYLLEQVATRVNRVLILLGVSPTVGKKNPLEYSLRENMVREWWACQFPSRDIHVLPLLDQPHDEPWAAQADALINAVNVNGTAIIYCGPDGAGPVYREAGGRWPIEVLDSMGGHASRLREAMLPRYSKDFRAGIIYGLERRFVNPYPVVDAIIRDGDRVLLGHKKSVDRDPSGREWRLIGGFVDMNDASLEVAVRREVLEETGLEVSEPMYVGSAKVDDWRFRSGPEGILSSVFSCERVFGEPRPSDDIDDLRWFHRDEVDNVIIHNHAHLFELSRGVQ